MRHFAIQPKMLFYQQITMFRLNTFKLHLVGLDGQIKGGSGEVVDVTVGSRQPDQVVVSSKPVEDLTERLLVNVGNVVQVDVLCLLIVLRDLLLVSSKNIHYSKFSFALISNDPALRPI